MGLLFQLPVVILAVTRMGILTPAQLRKHRRYAILVIAIVAALLPGGDPVTMLLMMFPILVPLRGFYPSRLAARPARCAGPRPRGGRDAATELTPLDPDD